jgi:response regulator of citrate/malate metabolism
MEQQFTKIDKAKVIIVIDNFRVESLAILNDYISNTPAIKTMLATQGNGELKLLVDKLKTDLVNLETKLEELL